MISNLQEVTNQALNLLPTDRIDLVERLLESVADFVEPQLEDHWRGIAVRRLAEHESGEISGVSAEVVHRGIRERLNESGIPSRSE